MIVHRQRVLLYHNIRVNFVSGVFIERVEQYSDN